MQEILTTFSSISSSFVINVFMGFVTILLFGNTVFAMIDKQEFERNGLFGYISSLALAVCGLVSIMTLWVAYNSKLIIGDIPLDIFVFSVALFCFLACFVFCLISIDHHDKKE